MRLPISTVKDLTFTRPALDCWITAPKANTQADLFSVGQTPHATQLMGVFDSINQRFGRGSVFLAAEGTEKMEYEARDEITQLHHIVVRTAGGALLSDYLCAISRIS